MKIIKKLILIILIILSVSCGTIKPNIMIGPTRDMQKTYIENMEYYK